ncbi:MAG: hypothetical protein NT033_09280, partial [Candidatus Omnitrophica bacterium]|nr:hypothetical protein [Candidatus Omnitrophota bacterium]
MRIFLEKKREGLFLLVFFVIACLLRFFQFSIFEFKNDQFAAIELGKATKQACFLVTHGIMSSINVYNPPLFTWFMGAVVYYTENPFYITLIFCLVNILALFLCLRYFLFRLPALYATIASSLVAFSPAFTIYSSNIWAQCLLPLPMILFYMNIHNL